MDGDISRECDMDAGGTVSPSLLGVERKRSAEACFLCLDAPALQFAGVSVQNLPVPCFSHVATVSAVMCLSDGSDFVSCAPLVRAALVYMPRIPFGAVQLRCDVFKASVSWRLCNNEMRGRSSACQILPSRTSLIALLSTRRRRLPRQPRRRQIGKKVKLDVKVFEILERNVVQNFDVLVEQNLDVHVPQILEEIVGELVVYEPVLQVPEALVKSSWKWL